MAKSSRRHTQRTSIKRRVIRLVLIPSVVALAIWLVASAYLVFTGFYDREVAGGVRSVSIPAVTGLSSIQRERRLSIDHLTQPARNVQELIDQRRQTDERLTALRTVADSALANAPESIKTRWRALTARLDQLPAMRTKIDAGAADRQSVYDYYNGLLDAATDLFDTQARVVPDVTATQGGIAATETFRASDQMSRAGSIIAAAFGSRKLSEEDYLAFVALVGAYHADLTNVAPHLRPSVQSRYQSLLASAPWQSLVSAENALIAGGRWNGAVPPGLPMTATSWEQITTQVSDALIGLTIAQADEVSAEALHTGNTQLLTALLGSLAALAIAIAAILWAIRQSQILVDRALSIRLAQLGEDAARVVDQRLPEMMARLRRREKVDPAVELPGQDYGSDEIGQLAGVLNRSLRVAIGAAVEEATTRAAGVAMLMGVARRPQRPVQRGLQVVEELQNRIGDEEVLAELFDVNHQLTQTRRFLENLIILAGGQTGRRFHKPVPVRRVLLAAIAETQQYKRITVRRTPDAALMANAVAGTTHLIAELLDNALTFSPPGSVVWMSCSRAKRGVVVEIEDAGVGMVREDLERANELLATAPTPDLTVLKEGTQVGLWVVAELAKRAGIRVTLRTSAYGGLLAIVLLPDRLLAGEPDGPADIADAAAPVPAPIALATVPEADAASPATGYPLDGGHATQPLAPAAATAVATADPVRANGASGLPAARGWIDADGDTMTDLPVVGTTGGAGPRSPFFTGGSATDRPPLPERRPQEHLAPELRDYPPEAGQPDEPEPARSPEEARNRFARYQQGWIAGRAADSHETPTGNDQDRKA